MLFVPFGTSRKARVDIGLLMVRIHLRSRRDHQILTRTVPPVRKGGTCAVEFRREAAFKQTAFLTRDRSVTEIVQSEVVAPKHLGRMRGKQSDWNIKHRPCALFTLG